MGGQAAGQIESVNRQSLKRQPSRLFLEGLEPLTGAARERANKMTVDRVRAMTMTGGMDLQDEGARGRGGEEGVVCSLQIDAPQVSR